MVQSAPRIGGPFDESRMGVTHLPRQNATEDGEQCRLDSSDWGAWARELRQTSCRRATRSRSTIVRVPRRNRSANAARKSQTAWPMPARATPSSRCWPMTRPWNAWFSAKVACSPACRREQRTFHRARLASPCRSVWLQHIARPVSTSWPRPSSDGPTSPPRASCSS